MTKRKKHVFDTGEIPHLWAHRTQEDARNRQGNLYFTGDTIYSYGSHFPIARHVTNDAGQRAVLFTTATYSVTTSSHCSAVRSAIPSGIPVFHVPNVCHGRYSGSELTAAIMRATWPITPSGSKSMSSHPLGPGLRMRRNGTTITPFACVTKHSLIAHSSACPFRTSPKCGS